MKQWEVCAKYEKDIFKTETSLRHTDGQVFNEPPFYQNISWACSSGSAFVFQISSLVSSFLNFILSSVIVTPLYTSHNRQTRATDPFTYVFFKLSPGCFPEGFLRSASLDWVSLLTFIFWRWLSLKCQLNCLDSFPEVQAVSYLAFRDFLFLLQLPCNVPIRILRTLRDVA